MMGTGIFMGKRGIIYICGTLLLLASCFGLMADDPITTATVTVKGVTLTVDPGELTVPINTSTIINTVFSVENPKVLNGMTVKAQLSGPGLTNPITLSTLPNHPISIPGLPRKGDYILENIQVEKDGSTIVESSPSQVLIHVADVIITQIEARPLTLDEIREKGIVITEENFTVYNFTVGFSIESETVIYEFPVVQTPSGVSIPTTYGGASGNSNIGNFPIPFKPEPFKINIDWDFGEEEDEDEEEPESWLNTPKIAGLLLFKNDIAFLNQFFSIMFIVSNNSPDGSNLELKDLIASISYPEGLREAETIPAHIPGTAIPVRSPGPDGELGTNDDLNVIVAGFRGMAEFLAEGLEEGSHIVKVDFCGLLGGLPQGDVDISGTAKGTVVVRNPEFAVTFAHPSIVREGEEYDLYVTLKNTSPVTANLVSLSLPDSRVMGAEVISDESVSWETIGSNESQTAHFRMRSKLTGEVRASCFEAEGSVSGRFILTTSVGEQGIPLSPDTLVLPSYAYQLPNEVINAAMMLLGEAYCIATSPPGSLPEGIPYISREIIETRVIEITEAGQRVQYGEELLESLEVLALDWQSNRAKDLPFDTLRRLTSKGIKLADVLSVYFNEALATQSAQEFQNHFAVTNSYKNPFFSAMLSFEGGPRNAILSISDYYQNALSLDSEDNLTRDIPFGEIYRMKDPNENPVDFALVGEVTDNSYKVEILGLADAAGSCSLSLIAPTTGGNLNQVTFSGINVTPSMTASIDVAPDAATYALQVDEDGDGTADQTIEGSVSVIEEPALKLVGAVQDCGLNKTGRVVALLFNKAVDQETSEIKENYFIEGNRMIQAFYQPSQRVVITLFGNAISPFVETKIKVDGVLDANQAPLSPDPTEMVVVPTIDIPGGMVYGKVMNALGNPIPNAIVELAEPPMSGYIWDISHTQTNDAGEYHFDYVRIVKSSPTGKRAFSITALDPATDKQEKVVGEIQIHGQRLEVNLFMRGRGSIMGRITDQNGLPVAGAFVGINPEYSGINEYYSTESDVNGEYRLDNVPLGRINIYSQLGGASGSTSTALSQAGEVVTADVIIYSGDRGTITGRVLSHDLVSPVTDAFVAMSVVDETGKVVEVIQPTRTDNDGYFSFEGVRTGAFTVVAYNPLNGKKAGEVHGQMLENQTVTVSIVLRGTGTINGSVEDHHGNPLAGILVYMNGTAFNQQTDADGKFSFPEVPIGSYSVTAYNSVTGVQTSASAQLIQEGQEAGVVLVFSEPAGTGAIKGYVQTSSGGNGIEAQVVVFDRYLRAWGQDRADATGHFQVDGLPPAGYLIAVQRGGEYGMGNATVLANGHLADAGTIQTRGYGSIVVKVFGPDGTTGVMADVELGSRQFVMIPGTEVGFVMKYHVYTTDENGNLTIENVMAGDVRMKAANAFYPKHILYSGNLTSGGTLFPEFILDGEVTAKGSIKVNVLTPEGNPAYGAVVKYTGATAGVDDQTTGIEGAPNAGFVEFGAILLGKFTVEASEHGGDGGYRNVANGYIGKEDEQVELTVRLKGMGTVSGRVLENDGETPVTGALVTLKNIHYPHQTYEFTGINNSGTDSNGYFIFNNVYEGDFSLSVTAGNLRGSLQGHIPGNGVHVEQDIRLQDCGTVQGTVYAPDGTTPIPSAQVILYRSSGVPYMHAISNSSGQYQFDPVPLGYVRVVVRDNATGRQGKSTGALQVNEEVLDLDVVIEGRGSVVGTFYDGSRVNTIPGAEVKIKSNGTFPFEMVTTTGSDGSFSFDHIGVGDFTLTATDPNTHMVGETEGHLDYEGHEVYEDIYAAGTGFVRCKVIKADDSVIDSPTGIFIELQGYKKILTYDSFDSNAKEFVFSLVPLASFTISANTNNGLEKGKVTDQVTFHGQVRHVEIKLSGFGSVIGILRDGSSNPVENGQVNLKGQGIDLPVTTPSDGSFSFSTIPVGQYSLYGTDGNLSASAGVVIANHGDVITQDLHLEPAGEITGTVFMPDGVTAAANAFLTLTLVSENRKLYDTTDENGQFGFESVKVGEFILQVDGRDNTGRARWSDSIDSDGEMKTNSMTLDDVYPEVVSVVPSNGTLGVPYNTFPVIIFSEEMAAVSVNTDNIYLTANGVKVGGTLVLSANQKEVTFTPNNPLQNFNLYIMNITNGVTDVSGNPLTISVLSSFTTVDTEGPRVTGTFPVANQIEVPLNAVITATFNEAIDITGFGASNFVVTEVGGSTLAGELSWNENHTQVSFASSNLYKENHVYRVQIQGARDVVGNLQTADTDYTFKSYDTVKPSLIIDTGGVGSVVEGRNIVVNASGDPDIAKIYFYLNGAEACVKSLVPTSCTVTAPRIIDGINTFVVDAIAQDAAGNISDKQSLTITIIPDQYPSAILSIGKTAGQMVLPDIQPGDRITCTVDANDDVMVQRIILNITGGTMSFSRTVTYNGVDTHRVFTVENILIPLDLLPDTRVQVQATVADSLWNTITTAPQYLNVPQDNSGPTIENILPQAGTPYDHKDTIQMEALVQDDIGIKQVDFYLQNPEGDNPPEILVASHTTPTSDDIYRASYQVLTNIETEKEIYFRVDATDLAGRKSSESRNIILKRTLNDSDPRITFVSPADGSLVFPGENLKIVLNGTDIEGISEVKLTQTVNGGSETDINTWNYTQSETSIDEEYAHTLTGVAQDDQIILKATITDIGGISTYETIMLEVEDGNVLLDGTLIDETDTEFENKTIVIKEGTVTINGSHTFKNILVKESGILTHSPTTISKEYRMDLTVSGKVSVGVDAMIDVSDKGYRGAHRDGNDEDTGRTLGNIPGSGRRSGGSYGGRGGYYDDMTTATSTYGSITNPFDPGSGGGGSSTDEGGNGGGVIKLVASELKLDGQIIADAGPRASNYGSNGSGGSVWISIDSVSGVGSIHANGSYSRYRSGGSGGRIAIYYGSNDGFDFNNIQAKGGTSGLTGATGKLFGGSGTVYLKSQSGQDELILDNMGIDTGQWSVAFPSLPPSTSTVVSPNVIEDISLNYLPNALKGMELMFNNDETTTYTVTGNSGNTITVDPADGALPSGIGETIPYKGKFVFAGHLKIRNLLDVTEPPHVFINGHLEVDDLSIIGNVKLTHGGATTTDVKYLNLMVNHTLFIDEYGSIDVTGRGYLGGWREDNLADEGRTVGNIPGSGRRSGGSHGGMGATFDSDYTPASPTYGSVFEPGDAGSGGGGAENDQGSNGGGILKITASQLNLAGQIVADGEPRVSSYGSGGSGGSVWIDAGTISGSGSVQANGSYSRYRSGGGGGRIAIYYDTVNGFNLDSISAFGGTSGYNSDPKYIGGAGTVYVKQNSQSSGSLRCDNNGKESIAGTPLIGTIGGEITSVSEYSITDANARFGIGSLKGMELIPNIDYPDISFTIVENNETTIFTDEADGSLLREIPGGGDTLTKVGNRYRLKSSLSIDFIGTQAKINGSVEYKDISMSNSTLTLDGEMKVENLILQSSTITHSPATISETHSLSIISDSLTIDESSVIDVSACGYLGGYSGDNQLIEGRTLGNVPGSAICSGGSYGGRGGKNFDADQISGGIYGSMYFPSDPGSGGGAFDATHPGSNGGGVIKIDAAELVLNGNILSNSIRQNDGGGSGGSIWLDVGTISGTGTIQSCGSGSRYQGGGGGGRIAVYYDTNNGYDFSNMTANGGNRDTSTDETNGAAGTIYLEHRSVGSELILDNKGRTVTQGSISLPWTKASEGLVSSANVIEDMNLNVLPGSLIGLELVVNNETTATFTIIDNINNTITTDPADGNLPAGVGQTVSYYSKFVFDGHLIIRNTQEVMTTPFMWINGDVEVDDLSVIGDIKVSHTGASISDTRYLSIKAGNKILIGESAFIDVSSQGYLGGYCGDNLVSEGRTLGNVAGSQSFSGGSHGGMGGSDVNGNYTSSGTYGSLYEPFDPGSGGGGNISNASLQGSNGGGVIKLVGPELQLDGGLISSSERKSEGSGSGGSIWIDVGTLSGTGVIQAHGGNSRYQGGGGGGRVAVYYEINSGFNWDNITTHGGVRTDMNTTTTTGGAGTIYLKKSDQQYGDLIVDNSGNDSLANSTPMPSLGAETLFTSTGLTAQSLNNSAGVFIPGAYIGMKLDPNALAGSDVFTIVGYEGNHTLLTDPADGDMTQAAVGGNPYIGEHFFFNLTVRGAAHLFTHDRITFTNLSLNDDGSGATLVYEEVQ